ncbi:MFS transporter [Catenulispora pinisilvae]|uniref:MFS transporter n=1 Tax=Catenulispora pinisilvae TaxID=2705253 RepID=UPI001891A8BF|nr:MFS transporter [Catenulispora pinisilvae]
MNPDLSTGRRRAILALLAVTVLIVVMDLTILNVAMNQIQAGLGASNADLQWALDSYLITFAAFLFTGGVTADRFGRKKVLIGGLLIFGTTSGLAAFSTSIGALILWRAVMGVGAAVVPTVTLALIIVIFPPMERAKAIAAWAAAAGVAFAVGPVLGGLLLDKFWWGSVFLVNVPLIVVAVALMIWLVPEFKNPNPAKFDPLGVVLSIVAVASLVYGIVIGGDKNDWTRADVLGPIAAGLVLAAVLVVVERRMASPALDVSLLRNSRFSAGTVVIALCFFALIGAIFITQFYYQTVLGYSPLKAGLLVLPMGIGSMVVSARCPKLVAKFGPRMVVTAGSLAMAISFALTSSFDAGTALVVLIVAQLLFGLGWGCIMAPATASLMSVVPPMKAAAGQAVSQTGRQVAGALGIAVIGSILGVEYRDSIGSAVNVLPAHLRGDAAGSIGGTLEAVKSAGLTTQAPALIHKAMDAYLSGMRVTMLVIAGVAVLAALVSLRWLPNQPPAPPMPPPAPPVPAAAKPEGAASAASAASEPAAAQSAPAQSATAQSSAGAAPVTGANPSGAPA